MTTHTRDAEDAGSDSWFYYTLTGTRGQTAEYRADNLGNDRRRGATETWTWHDSTDIGEFRCIRIRMSGNDGWGFDWVIYIIHYTVYSIH